MIRAFLVLFLIVSAWPRLAPAEAGSAPAKMFRIELTASEKKWLKQHPRIRLAYDGALPPYSFVGVKGRFDGIAVDILDTLSRRLGVKFDVLPSMEWPTLYKKAVMGKIDVIATLVDRPERRLWFNFTQPYLTKSLVIITRRNNAAVKSRSDLDRKRISLVRGYHYSERVVRDFPAAKPYYVNSLFSGLKAVANGKADAAVTFMATANYLQALYGLDNLQFADFYDRNSANESIAVRKDWPMLVDILQKGLDSLSETEMQKMFSKWVLKVDEPADVPVVEKPIVLPAIEAKITDADYAVIAKIVLPFLAVLSFLIAWLIHAHSQNRRILQSKNQIMISNRNLQTLQNNLEQLVLQRTAELNSSEQKFRSLVENLRNEYFFYSQDHTGRFTYVSPSVTTILGYAPDEFIANYRSYLTDNPINFKSIEYADLSLQGVPNPPYQIEIYDHKKIMRWLEISNSPVYDEYGNCIGADAIAHDITVRKLADEKLVRLSYYDELTGLANRRLFLDRLQQALNLAYRNRLCLALIYLDLDRFKIINDTLGHAAGDEMLREAARRIVTSLRESDVPARFGGDEFVILLPGADADAAKLVAQKILKIFQKPYLLENKIETLAASIGIAVYPQDATDENSLIRCADNAMYQCKKEKLGFVFYSDNLSDTIGHYARSV